MKYLLPNFLEGVISDQTYRRWLQRKAIAHFRRDSKRGFKKITITYYKQHIHEAVIRSKGQDVYTGEKLDWALVSKYRNEDTVKKDYKKSFYHLPTLDHCHEDKKHIFAICSWMTNSMKGDMTRKLFVAQCKKVIRHLSNA